MKNLIQSLFLWIEGVFQGLGQRIAILLEDNEHQTRKSSIAVLDGVRAIAILMVIIFHINRVTGDNLWDRMANPLASSISTAGGTGVTLFFVLSGFLLFMPFAKALLFKTSWPLGRVFYLRRALRIIPGYYVSLFLIILFQHPEYLHRDHLKGLVLFLTFFMDSSRSTFRQLNGPFWTLATEWQFYMLLPLIALGIALLVKRVPVQRRLQGVMLCILGVIAGGLCVRFWGLYFLYHPSVTFLVPRGVLNVALFFSFGITGKYTEDFAVGMLVSLCYIYAQQLSAESRFVQRWQRLSPWLWGGGILLLVFTYMWHFNHEMHGWPFLNGLLPVYDWLSEMLMAFGYGACIAAILYGSKALKRPFEWPVLRWGGLISYSLYMWHLPLLILFMSRVLPLFHGLNRYTTYGLFWLWALMVVFPFAFLSFILVEKPWMKLGEQWRRGIEKRHWEELKRREAALVSKQEDGKEAASFPQEAITR